MKIEYVIIHCSATDNPSQWDFHSVKELHTAPSAKAFKWGKYDTRGRAWSDIGYHYYIERDGKIVSGRNESEMGAHCLGWNNKSLGVCLAGNSDFTVQQFTSLTSLIRLLRTKHDFELVGHNDLSRDKSCPNFNVKKVLMCV